MTIEVRPLGAVVLLAVGLLTSACGGARSPAEAVPTFPSAQHAAAPVPRARATLLPDNCAGVLAGTVDMSALLGQPMDSVQSTSVVGTGAPTVGRLAQTTCQYRRSSADRSSTEVALTLSAYTDAHAAERHTATNIEAERTTAGATQNTSVGAAPAVYLEQPDQSLLFVVHGRSALTVAMRHGIVPASQDLPLMLDLAQRVLPNLAPEPTTSR